MTDLICRHCQAKNEAGTELCVACGQPLRVADAGNLQDAGKDSGEREEVERWVSQLPKSGRLDPDRLTHDDESLPEWLSAVRAHADQLTDQEADELLDFLAELDPSAPAAEGDAPVDDEAVQAKMTADLPSWVAALVPEEEWPETESDEDLAEHLADVVEEDEEPLPSTAELRQTRPLADSAELKGIPEALAAHSLPEWLDDLQEKGQAPGSEMPPQWPGRASHSPAAATEEEVSEPAQPDVHGEGASESKPTVETIDSVLDELEQTAMQAPGPPEEPREEVSDYSEWMDPAQAAALEETLDEIMGMPEAETSVGRVDQWLDILEGLPGQPDAEQMDQAFGDSDVEQADIPDWMDSLGPGDKAQLADPAELGPPEDSGPLAGLRGVVPAAAISLVGTVDRSSTKLEMTKEQRQQAALLHRLTAAEPEAAATAEPPVRDSFLPVRLALGAALLLAILLGLLVPGLARLLPQPGAMDLPAAATDAQAVISAGSGQTALVAFDYTPSMAGELDPVAAALLADLAANDIAVLTVSQVAAGVPMADRATRAIEDLDSRSLGYLPGEASGLRALSRCLDRGCETLAGRQIGSETSSAFNEVGLILVLTADRDSLVGWIEQVGTQTDTPIIVGVTQAMAPIAAPYVLSQQLAGLLAGLPVAITYGEETSMDGGPSSELQAGLTLAQWLAIAALSIGVIYFGFVAPAASAVSEVAKK